MKLNVDPRWKLIGLVAAIWTFVQTEVHAQVIVTKTQNLTYTQNFDGLASTGNSNAWTDNSTILGWYASQSSYRASDGGVNGGGMYSYGSTGSTERALGAISTTGQFTQFGLTFQNNTNHTINSIQVAFVGEQWRRANAINQLGFSYKVNGTGLDDTGYTDVAGLNFNTPQAGNPPSALDGNAAANRQQLSQTIAVTILPGETIWMRWRETLDAAEDAGMAIDDVSISFGLLNTAPTPPVGGIPNYTTTCGETFSASLPAFTDAENDPITYSLTTLPTGLSFDSGTQTISGLASVAGVTSMTLTANDNCGGITTATFTITIPECPLPPNQPPYNSSEIVPNYMGACSAPVSETLPAFTDPEALPLTYALSGLPSGLSFEAGSRVISGATSTTGAFSLTLTVTDVGEPVNTVQQVFTLTITPCEAPPNSCGSPANTLGQPFTLVAPTYNCATGVVQFNTVGGDGSPITFAAIGIVSATQSCTDALDYEVAQDIRICSPNVQPFTITATQNGNTVTFIWNAMLACGCNGSEPPVNPPPVVSSCDSPTNTIGNPLQLLQPIYNCSTGDIRFIVTGGNGSPIEFAAVGIMPWGFTCTDQLDTEVAQDIRDQKPNVAPFMIYARQNGVTASYSWNALAACSVSSRIARPEDEFTVNLLDNPTTGSFGVEVTGARGQTLHFRLTDSRGRTLETRTAGQTHAKERYTFTVNNQTSGLLLLQIDNNTVRKTLKVIKQ